MLKVQGPPRKIVQMRIVTSNRDDSGLPNRLLAIVEIEADLKDRTNFTENLLTESVGSIPAERNFEIRFGLQNLFELSTFDGKQSCNFGQRLFATSVVGQNEIYSRFSTSLKLWIEDKFEWRFFQLNFFNLIEI
jgi:hypothetical protein